MTCTHTGPNGGPLICTRPAGHAHGHVYESTSAGDDRHLDGGHG